MSIKYDLLQDQINALMVAIDPYGVLAPDEKESLNGVKALLEYLMEEKDSSNLNVWEDESDHAANVADISLTERAYNEMADKDGFICIRWGWQDVESRANDRDISLTKDQCMDILMYADRRHDACIGISWDVLDVYIDMEISG